MRMASLLECLITVNWPEDFGSAKFANGSTYTTVGTPDFFAPEMVKAMRCQSCGVESHQIGCAARPVGTTAQWIGGAWEFSFSSLWLASRPSNPPIRSRRLPRLSAESKLGKQAV